MTELDGAIESGHIFNDVEAFGAFAHAIVMRTRCVNRKLQALREENVKLKAEVADGKKALTETQARCFDLRVENLNKVEEKDKEIIQLRKQLEELQQNQSEEKNAENIELRAKLAVAKKQLAAASAALD